MNTNSRITAGILLVAPAVTIVGVLIPAPASWDGSWLAFHSPLVLTMTYTWLHFGAAILFISGVRAYKAMLRYAYVSLSIGIVLTALAVLQLPIINGFDLWQSPWVVKGFISMPFLLAGLVMYIGMRQLGISMRLKSILTRISVIVPTVIAVSAMGTLLPHAPLDTPEIGLDITIAITLWGSLLNFTSAAIVLKIKQRVGQHYVSAMAWLFAVLAMSGVVLLVALANLLVSNGTNEWIGLLTNTIGLFLGFLWVKAGHAFYKTKEV